MSERRDDDGDTPPRVAFADYLGAVSTSDDVPSAVDEPGERDDAEPTTSADPMTGSDDPMTPSADTPSRSAVLAERLGDDVTGETRRRREIDAAALIRPEVTATTRRGWWFGRRARRRAAQARAEAQALHLVAQIRAPVPSPSTIAVASTKGGVGKTTTTLLLGTTLAAVRDDRAVAVDANPDAGSLARRIQRTSTANAVDLLDLVGSVQDYYDLRHFTSMTSSGLEVIAAADDPRDTRGISAADTDELLTRLRTWYPLVLADCGTGTLTPSIRTILQRADVLVVVTAARVDAARSVDEMMSTLEHRGLADAVGRAVVAVNAVHPRSGIDVDAVVDHFRDRVSAAVAIPWDAELARGGIVDVDALTPATRHAHALLATAVVDSLRGPRHRRATGPGREAYPDQPAGSRRGR